MNFLQAHLIFNRHAAYRLPYSGVIGTPLALLFATHMLQGFDLLMIWGWVLFRGAVALQVIPFLCGVDGFKEGWSISIGSAHRSSNHRH
jgi:hypothetical protein